MWVRREKERELQAAGKADLPWPLYLVFSVLVSIAAVRVCCCCRYSACGMRFDWTCNLFGLARGWYMACTQQHCTT